MHTRWIWIASNWFITCRNHLSSNLFFLYIFGEPFLHLVPPKTVAFLSVERRGFCKICCHSGKLVEEEEGNFALWLSYILTGAGANLVSWLVLPRNAVSIGASGAVFGLFAVSVLVKVNWKFSLMDSRIGILRLINLCFASDVLRLEEDPRSTNFGAVCCWKGT